MSYKLVKRSDMLLPEKIGNMTLNQLINQDDVEFHKKDNIVQFKKVTPTRVALQEIHTYEDWGAIVSQSSFFIPEKKKDLKPLIKKLKKEGMKQKQIADHLGISQPYVSILLKD